MPKFLSAVLAKRSALALAAALTVGMIAGCSEHKTRVVDADDPHQRLTSRGIDPQDFKTIAAKLTQNMLNAPRLQGELRPFRDGSLPLVKISRIQNDTDLKINMVDYLVTPIEQEFTNSGKVDFVSEDEAGKDIAAGQEVLGRTNGKAVLPDYVLFGKVSKLSTADAGTRQNYYKFEMRVTRTKDNVVVFVGNLDTAKQYDR
jgi:PBP1b-binding outer membrane lipoprotein LpoB